MGYTTDFIGHIDVTPPLNESEQAYLTAFGDSRRYDRTQGPYEVPGNPATERNENDDPVERRNRTASQQPGFWCDWTPCWDGCCVTYDGREKFYDSVRWMEYLIEHFLRPGACAQASGSLHFEDFTFDHRLDGLIIGCRRDNKELFAIRVEDNVVTEEILRPADRRYVEYPPFPYEEENDRYESPRQRKRRLRRQS